MCKRNSGLPNRPGPSLPAEGNLELEDDVEIEKGENLFIDIMKNFV